MLCHNKWRRYLYVIYSVIMIKGFCRICSAVVVHRSTINGPLWEPWKKDPFHSVPQIRPQVQWRCASCWNAPEVEKRVRSRGCLQVNLSPRYAKEDAFASSNKRTERKKEKEKKAKKSPTSLSLARSSFPTRACPSCFSVRGFYE